MGQRTTSSRTYSIRSREGAGTRDPRVDDFDAFYESWYPRAVAIASRKGLPDPEAAAQEVMMVCWRTDYLQRQPQQSRYSFDSFVANLVHRRFISMQRQELRRRSIAPMERIGARDFSQSSRHADLQERLSLATDIIREEYPDWFDLWSAVIVQVLLGKATVSDKVDRREFASRAGMSQRDLEAKVAEFVELVRADYELAELLDVDRSPVSA